MSDADEPTKDEIIEDLRKKNRKLITLLDIRDSQVEHLKKQATGLREAYADLLAKNAPPAAEKA